MSSSEEKTPYELQLDAWAVKRNDGNYYADIPEVNFLITSYLRPAIQKYLNNQKDQKVKREVQEILNDMVRVMQTSGTSKGASYPGTTRLMEFLYTNVFKELHDRFKENLNQVGRGVRQPSAEDRVISEILKVPNSFFPAWIQKYVPEVTQPLEPVRLGKRERLVTGFKKKSGGPKKVQLPPKEVITSPAEGGPFRVSEPLGVKPFMGWTSKVLMFQPISAKESSSGNEGLRKMVYDTEKMLTDLDLPAELPRIDDLILLRQEARFWLEEFFNFLVEPCDFANPWELKNADTYSKYRTRVMVPLVKLSIMLNKKYYLTKLAIAHPTVFGQLIEPIMTFQQWREYLSLHFPDAAALMFDGTAHEFYQKNPAILSTLEKIQKLFVTHQKAPQPPPEERMTPAPSQPRKRRIPIDE